MTQFLALPQDLPPRRAVDHAIDLDDNARPASRGLIRLSPPEMMELQRQLEELLARGYIRPSTSQYGASVFFVKKNDAAGSLRLVCDYRALNSSTIKNHACMPHPETCFEQVKGARFFTKLDLAQGFHQIRLREGDEHKTAINTPFGHFEWTVLCFGLTNGPATLQTLMYDLLRPFLHKCAANMADDILIYSKTFSDHTAHVSAILDTLAAAQLYCKASKCEFFVPDVRFLGFRVSGETLQVDTSKLEGLAEHPSPVTVPEVRRFVGFCNFFRKFVPRYADIVRPLTALTHKFARFLWSTECQKAFDTLKDALLSAPVLLLPDPSSQFHLFTDASDVALGAVLQQADAIGQLHPVAFASRQLRDAETRYAALDRETLAFVFGLTMFKTYLFSKFVAHTDSSVLSHFKTKATLSARDQRWVQLIANFDFDFEHCKGINNVADALSRRADYYNFTSNAIEGHVGIDGVSLAELRSGYASDTATADIIDKLTSSDRASDNVHKRFRWHPDEGKLYLVHGPGWRLYVPDCSLRLLLLKQHHDCIAAGHPGRDRTYARLSRHYYWPRMSVHVAAFVSSCDSCQRSKPNNRSPAGFLQPLPVPVRPWERVGMDFIVALPLTSRGHDAIFTFVDALTKMVHFIPTSKRLTAIGAADLYIANVFRAHGLPLVSVSDRDSRFTSEFWTQVMQRLQIDRRMTVSNRAEADGQPERMHRLVEEVLRNFTNYMNSDWDTLLPLVEFSINDAVNEATGQTPFFLNYGFHPSSPSDLLAGPSTGPLATSWLAAQADALRVARDELVAAQERQAQRIDNGRTPLRLKVGDLVLVSRDFLIPPEARARPSPKLCPRYYGPFKVLALPGANTARLDLPATLRVHRVFNTSSLRLYVPNIIAGRLDTVQPPAPVLDLDGETRYMVEAVLAQRVYRRKQQYLVQWSGYAEPTWEPENFLRDESGQDLQPLRLFKETAG